MNELLPKLKTQQFLFKKRETLSNFPTEVERLYDNDEDFDRLSRTFADRSADRQNLLFAERKFGVIAIFQGMDTSGKDGAIKHVFRHLNPLGVEASAFGAPSSDDKKRDFLWRTHSKIPPRGKVGLFNRSYYEEVLTVRVHPELLAEEKLPFKADKEFWKTRFEDIRNFEAYLHNQGYLILKFYLHMSREVQRERLLARIDDHRKNWKFDPHDLEDREKWSEFMRAYEDCFKETSTKTAPWYIVPADDKKNARLITAAIFNEYMERLPLEEPSVSESQRKLLKKLRKSL